MLPQARSASIATPVSARDVPAGAAVRVQAARLASLDLIRATAVIWIFLNHVAERLFSFPYIANPGAGWPPLAERVQQLQPLAGYGVWTLPANILRYVGWVGDQGVQLFLIASGFGLTWALLHRYGRGTFPLGPFYLDRAKRILPLWWGAHVLFLALAVVLGLGLSPTDPNFYLSLAGLRVTPSTLYYFAPAWWYVTVLIQLYLVYPLLWQGLRRLGPTRLLLVACVVAFGARAIGLLTLDGYLDAWSRGAIFITRLPEFAFGMALAGWLHDNPAATQARLRAPVTLVGAVIAYAIGTALSLTLVGMTFAPFLTGVSAFILLGALFSAPSVAQAVGGIGGWVGRHSYSLFLVQHPVIVALVPATLLVSPVRVVGGIVAATVGTVALALALEAGVNATLRGLSRAVASLGLARTAMASVAGVLLLLAGLVGAELAVRAIAPQEVLGWGERPSLMADPNLGWRLQPSQTTRLRWESYDYRVTANALGFPGPEYPPAKAPGAFRILVTGDAFSSAEGVNTDQAWPRLLEDELRQRLPNTPVEVMNFAVTGYGPNQYAEIIQDYAPTYQPDLIVVEMFVNDYLDALTTNDAFQASIGFGERSPDGLMGVLGLTHLRQFLRMQVREPLAALIKNRPEGHGYSLGNFTFLERDWPAWADGQRAVEARLQQIEGVANQTHTPVMIVMAPAAPQVCAPRDLAYYPRNVDLSDTSRFDLDKPQRLTQSLADQMQFTYVDLRPVLRQLPDGCPYQPSNMHWTVSGHRAVADFLAARLAQTRLAGGS